MLPVVLVYQTNRLIQIVIAGVINGHVACKYVYVRLFRGTNRMQERSLLSVGSWVAIVLVVWVIAWVIAESIPIFNNLLGLIVRVARENPYCVFIADQRLTGQYHYRLPCSPAGLHVRILPDPTVRHNKLTARLSRWLGWHLLALLKLGPVVLILEEESTYDCEHGYYLHRGMYCAYRYLMVFLPRE